MAKSGPFINVRLQDGHPLNLGRQFRIRYIQPDDGLDNWDFERCTRSWVVCMCRENGEEPCKVNMDKLEHRMRYDDWTHLKIDSLCTTEMGEAIERKYGRDKLVTIVGAGPYDAGFREE